MASGAIWAELHMALRERIGRDQPLGGGSRQPIDQIGRKGGGKDSQSGLRCQQAGQGRKIHALVDSEGLPMRVVVHSAAIQDATRPGWSSTRHAGASLGSN
jgi:hypothetical protein